MPPASGRGSEGCSQSEQGPRTTGIQTSGLHDCKIIQCRCFKATAFAAICNGSHKKLTRCDRSVCTCNAPSYLPRKQGTGRLTGVTSNLLRVQDIRSSGNDGPDSPGDGKQGKPESGKEAWPGFWGMFRAPLSHSSALRCSQGWGSWQIMSERAGLQTAPHQPACGSVGPLTLS